MKIFALLPILIPFGAAILCLAFSGFRNLRQIFGVGGTLLHFASGIALFVLVKTDGIQVLNLGNWPAPFGISIVVDLFSAIMVLIASFMGLVLAVYSLKDIEPKRQRFGYFPFYHFLLMGVCGTFITGDMFNLYVWFEVMLLSSFILLTLGGERNQIEGAIKYVSLNLVSSVLFLTALGILYGVSGTLNMADLAVKIRTEVPQGLATTVAMLFLVAFGIKAAMFPLFFWLPASYHTPPVAVTAIFSALLTKVGVYSLIRTFTLLFTQDIAYTHTIILVLAGLTMVTGVLGAVAQNEMRRLLSFHIISQIGYLLMGLGLMTPLALAGVVYFMIHVIIAKSALFLVSGIANHFQGTFNLYRLGGLYRNSPALATLFLIAAFSLAGLPPFSGFFAKLALVKAGLEVEQYLIVAVSLFVGILTLFSMMKIWNMAFWTPKDEKASGSTAVRHRQATKTFWGPLVVLSSFALLIGIFAEPVFKITHEAATQLLEPQSYISSVLAKK